MNSPSASINHAADDDFQEYEKKCTSSLTNLPSFHYKKVVTRSYASNRMDLKKLFELNKVLPPRFESLVTKFPQIGNFLKLKFEGQFRASLIHLIWIRLLEKNVKNSDYHEFWFNINNKPTRMSVEEFSLVSGLKFGEYSKEKEKLKTLPTSKLLKIYFPNLHENLSVKTLFETITTEMEKSKNENVFDDDLLKLIYVFIIGAVCMVKKSLTIDLWIFKVCDDLNYCENFPWGNIVWETTCEKLFNKTLRSFENCSKGSMTYEQEGCPLIMLVCFVESIIGLGDVGEIKVGDKCAYPRMLRYEVNRGATACSIINLDRKIDKIKTAIPRLKPDETEMSTDYYIKTRDWFSSVIHKNQSLSYKKLNEIFSNYVILHDDVSCIESGQPRRPPLVVEPQPTIADEDGEGDGSNDEAAVERRSKRCHDRPSAPQPSLMDIYEMMKTMAADQKEILDNQKEILNNQKVILNKLDKKSKSKEDEEENNEEKDEDDKNEDSNENSKSDHEGDNVISTGVEDEQGSQTHHLLENIY